MIKTLSLFPIKTAQPPLVGKTARTCTSITVLFIPGERYPQREEKQGRLIRATSPDKNILRRGLECWLR
jgi:hypothetical protein